MRMLALEVHAWLLQATGWPGGTGLATAALRLALDYWPGCYSPQVYRPQVGLGVLACLQPTWGTVLAATALRIAGGTGQAVTGLRFAWGFWPGCYTTQVSLGVLAWLLQARGWPGGTGVAATGSRLA